MKRTYFAKKARPTTIKGVVTPIKKKNKRYYRNSDMTDIHGISTKKEAEAYLNSIALTYPLEQLIDAMLLCFGLRLHEL